MVNSASLSGKEFRCHGEGSWQLKSSRQGRIIEISHFVHEMGNWGETDLKERRRFWLMVSEGSTHFGGEHMAGWKDPKAVRQEGWEESQA